MIRPILQIIVILIAVVGFQQLFQNTTRSESVASNVSTSTGSEQIAGRVVRVIDGDTVSVLDANNIQHRIRLSQIDAPETKQAYSTAAKEALSTLIVNKEVLVKVNGIDRYKRVLGELVIGDQNVNLYMVRNGFAWAYTAYVTDTHYFEAQELAQKEQRGLWADSDAVAPWDFRQQQRDQRQKKQ